MDASRCELCRRVVPALTRHHLVPRTRHSNERSRRGSDRGQIQRIAMLCKPCHKQIHALLDEKELARRYDTLEALRTHPELARFLSWIRDKPGDLALTSYRANRRRRTTRRGPR